MEMIRPNLWIGSANTIRYASAYMAHVGIRNVLNVAKEINYRLDGFNCSKLNMQDGWEPGFNRIDFDISVGHAIGLLETYDRINQPTLVHCAEGKSRSVHVLSRYLAHKENVPYENIWHEIRSYRPCVHDRSFDARYGT